MISKKPQKVVAYASSAAITGAIAVDLVHLLLYSQSFRHEAAFQSVAYSVAGAVVAATAVAFLACRRRVGLLPVLSTGFALCAALLAFVLAVRFTHPFASYPAISQATDGGAGLVMSRTLALRRAAGELIMHFTALAFGALITAIVAALAVRFAMSRRLTKR